MAVLPIYIYGSEILKKKTKPVKEIDDSKVKLLIDMFETLKNSSGFGLAANQVGLPLSLAVLDLSSLSDDEKDEDYIVPAELKKPLILFNPEIIKSWDEATFEEGCLSIPELRAEVVRPDSIKVKYRDGEFNEKVLEIGGILSRVMQHEIDHLNGKLYVEHLGKVKFSLLRKRLKKIQNGEVKLKYPMIFK
jgi:peptide deformylase